ncbi:MAG: glycosyltransferase [Bacteroidota bacterium]|nr:glycosyltransferase [Bacteroidota bacterium]
MIDKQQENKFLVSIIIPTYNRRDILFKCLEVLSKQVFYGSFEVLVIDDGSTDQTAELLNQRLLDYPYSLRSYEQKKKGPAAARNIGISVAKGEIIIFLGDDTLVSERFIQEHYLWQIEKYPSIQTAILGRIEWDSSLEITPLMEFLNRGPQFNFPSIEQKIIVDFNYFVSSNISLKREFIKDMFFDESFSGAAWEDVEYAFRLSRHGMKIYYNKNAVCFHHHPTDMESLIKRSYFVGKNLKLLHTKWPEFLQYRKAPSFGIIQKMKKWILRIISPFGKYSFIRPLLFQYYAVLHRENMHRGYYNL